MQIAEEPKNMLNFSSRIVEQDTIVADEFKDMTIRFIPSVLEYSEQVYAHTQTPKIASVNTKTRCIRPPNKNQKNRNFTLYKKDALQLMQDIHGDDYIEFLHHCQHTRKNPRPAHKQPADASLPQTQTVAQAYSMIAAGKTLCGK